MRDRGLKNALERVRAAGTHGDTILAHINPEEAHWLSERNGGHHINPHTGLPAFFNLKKAFKPIQKILHSKAMQKIMPIMGGAVGQMVGGPAGAAIGAGYGRAVTHRTNMGKSFLKGGMHGLIGGSAASVLGGAMGMPTLVGGQGSGTMFGNGPGSIAGSLGGMGASLTGRNTPAQVQQQQMPQQGVGQMGGPGNGAAVNGLFGGYNGGDNRGGAGGSIFDMFGGPLNAALLGGGLYGMLNRKEKIPHENLPDLNQMRKKQWGPEDQPKKTKPYKRKYKEPPADYYANAGSRPEWEYFENPEPLEYAHGGYVDGDSGGQDDDVDMGIPEGSYVMDATTVSLLGDGNSRSGAKKIKELEDRFLRSHIVRNPKESQNVRIIDAKLSPGEYPIRPRAVTALGGGSNKNGAKKFDKMRDEIRKQKGVSKFLPPKSKQLLSYLR